MGGCMSWGFTGKPLSLIGWDQTGKGLWAVETAEGIYAALDEIKTASPTYLDYVVPFESVSVVEVSIIEDLKTFGEALLLVILVVFLFLQSWRATLVPILAIPGSFILDHRFPNYLYPGDAFNHPGNRLKHLSTRKYRMQSLATLPPSGQSLINNIVIRYADVLLAKAEEIIETNRNIDDAVKLINRIRTERNDVNITSLMMGLTQSQARQKLRQERRIEFALEGLYWSDIKRWKIGKDIYPVVVRDQVEGIIETKFPNGYLEYYDLLPISLSELSLNEKLVQNPGW